MTNIYMACDECQKRVHVTEIHMEHQYKQSITLDIDLECGHGHIITIYDVR